MVDCCELALYNGRLALYIALGAFGVIALLIVVAFGYSLKWKKQQIELSKRTEQLEKNNGAEQINELKKEVEKLKNESLSNLPKEKSNN